MIQRFSFHDSYLTFKGNVPVKVDWFSNPCIQVSDMYIYIYMLVLRGRSVTHILTNISFLNVRNVYGKSAPSMLELSLSESQKPGGLRKSHSSVKLGQPTKKMD